MANTEGAADRGLVAPPERGDADATARARVYEEAIAHIEGLKNGMTCVILTEGDDDSGTDGVLTRDIDGPWFLKSEIVDALRSRAASEAVGVAGATPDAGATEFRRASTLLFQMMKDGGPSKGYDHATWVAALHRWTTARDALASPASEAVSADAPVSEDAGFYYRAWRESGDKITELADRIATERARAARLEGALAKYGRHTRDCRSRAYDDVEDYPCNCGLDAALASPAAGSDAQDRTPKLTGGLSTKNKRDPAAGADRGDLDGAEGGVDG